MITFRSLYFSEQRFYTSIKYQAESADAKKVGMENHKHVMLNNCQEDRYTRLYTYIGEYLKTTQLHIYLCYKQITKHFFNLYFDVN